MKQSLLKGATTLLATMVLTDGMAGTGGGSNPAVTVNDGGSLTVNSTLTVNEADIVVENGGVMTVTHGSVTNAVTLEVQVGGILRGCGTINAVLLNNGTIYVECGPEQPLILTGEVTNNGDIIVTNDSELVATTATFTNNGLLDLRLGTPTLPTLLVNNGTVLLPDDPEITITGTAVSGLDFIVTADAAPGSDYQLEQSFDLQLWTPLGATQAGGNGLQFIHVNGMVSATGKSFYRIVEVPAP